MSQTPHFVATETPADIGDGLAPGCYVAQVRGGPGLPGVIYATAAMPPASLEDYFQCERGAAFVFTVGPGEPATWVRFDPEASAYGVIEAPVAVARIDP